MKFKHLINSYCIEVLLEKSVPDLHFVEVGSTYVLVRFGFRLRWIIQLVS